MFHYDVLINWSKCGQKLDNNGQEVYHYGIGGRQWSAIVFTVFETFLNGQTVFRYVSKRIRNILKQCSKSGHYGASQGSPGGQPGVTRESARGQVGVSHSVYIVQDVFKCSNSVQICVEKGTEYFKTMFKKWSARGQPGVRWGSAKGQPGVTRGSARIHQGVSQGSPGVSQGSGRGQPRVSQGSARGQPGVIGIFS